LVRPGFVQYDSASNMTWPLHRTALAVVTAIGVAIAGTRAQPLPAGAQGSNAARAPVQPLPFSHRLHVGVMGLECADCHSNADPKRVGYPATDTCMTCHKANPGRSETLQRLSAMAGSGRPIPWRPVYQLPTYVYWQHRPHLAAKVSCVECHGPVEERDVTTLETDVTTMRGCQRCHEKRQMLTDCADCHEPRQ
jgi:hypothetical protein